MLIFLYGEDTFRSRQKLSEMRERYQGVHVQAVNLKQIDCSTAVFSDLKEELQGQSLFREKKLLIIRNIFQNPELARALFENKKLLEQESGVIVFFEEGTPKKSSPAGSLFTYLTVKANSQEFAPLEKSSLKKWIAGEFQKYKTAIRAEAIDILSQEAGSDLWRLSNEIKKLAAFARSRKGLVESSDVEMFLGKRLEANIFSTIQDVALKNKKKALEQLASHLQNGESPLYLLSMIAFQFRNMLIVRETGTKNKLHPFVAQKTLPVAQKFSLQELKGIYEKIFTLDLKMKTGAVAPELALHAFISQL